MTVTQDAARGSLEAIGMLDLLENDRRPTFVVPLDTASFAHTAPLQPIFHNKSMRQFPALQHAICTEPTTGAFKWPAGQSYDDFRHWTCQAHGATASFDAPINYRNLTWDAITIHGRWNVISGRLGSQPYTTSFMDTLMRAGPGKSELRSSSPASPTSNARFNLPRSHRRGESMGQSKEGQTPSLMSVSDIRDLNDTHGKQGDSSSDDEETGSAYPGQNSQDSTVAVPAHQYDKLVVDLRLQREELIKKTRLMDQLAAMEAVAIAVTTADGEIVFCNEAWYRICDFPRGITSALAWMNVFLDEDLSKAQKVWESCVTEKQAVQFDARFKKRWRPPFKVEGEPEDTHTHIFAAVYPDLSEEGDVIGAVACVIDISEQKWVERIQARRIDEALERANLLDALNKEAAKAQAKQDEAARNQLRFRRIADLLPNAVFIAAKDRFPIYGNQTFHDMFCTRPEKPEIIPWEDIFFDKDWQAGHKFWNKLTEDKVASSLEARMKRLTPPTPTEPRPWSGHRWIIISAYPELDDDGNLKHVTGCITDVSTLKETEQLQLQRLRDVTESRKQQEAFIDMTSHEIRNPLSSIVHCADEITSCLKDLPELSDDQQSISKASLLSAKEAAETILFCTQHTKRIVDDILTLSKLNSKILRISPVAVEAKSTVTQALKMFEGELRAANIDLELVIDDSLDQLQIEWVQLDTSRILQILVNLIGNSVKFTQFEEKRRIRVALYASTTKPSESSKSNIPYLPPLDLETAASTNSQDQVYLEYVVQDSGCGISADGQKMLFNRFSQGSTRTHVKYGGHGLGLFISRQLCELQGGQMGFQSEFGVGSTFAFFAKTHKVATPVTSHAGPELKTKTSFVNVAPSPGPQHAFLCDGQPVEDDGSRKSQKSGLHVLLVEDNLINQKVLGKQLRKRGFEVSIANHGEEALAHLQETRLWAANKGEGRSLTVVLMDVEMPIMDGMTCVRRIRELQSEGAITAHVPVIAITANARSQQIDNAMAAGMDHVVSKPFRMPELVGLIDRIGVVPQGEPT